NCTTGETTRPAALVQDRRPQCVFFRWWPVAVGPLPPETERLPHRRQRQAQHFRGPRHLDEKLGAYRHDVLLALHQEAARQADGPQDHEARHAGRHGQLLVLPGRPLGYVEPHRGTVKGGRGAPVHRHPARLAEGPGLLHGRHPSVAVGAGGDGHAPVHPQASPTAAPPRSATWLVAEFSSLKRRTFTSVSAGTRTGCTLSCPLGQTTSTSERTRSNSGKFCCVAPKMPRSSSSMRCTRPTPVVRRWNTMYSPTFSCTTTDAPPPAAPVRNEYRFCVRVSSAPGCSRPCTSCSSRATRSSSEPERSLPYSARSAAASMPGRELSWAKAPAV